MDHKHAASSLRPRQLDESLRTVNRRVRRGMVQVQLGLGGRATGRQIAQQITGHAEGRP
jgi:hypothetical protein